MASTGEVWRLGRRPALDTLYWLLPAVASFAWSVYFWPRGANDWTISREAGALLIGGHFDVYARMPEAQMGPLALLLSGTLPAPLYLLAVAGLLAVTARFIIDAFGHRGVVLAGALLAAWPWSIYALEGHADDALVVTAAAGMVAAHRRGSPLLATVAFLVGVAGKPTALMFLPLVFLTSRRAGLIALAGGGLLWAPFALADLHGFLVAGGGVVDVNAGSLLNLLGVPVNAPYPGWLRPTMFAAALLVCWTVGRRNVAAAVMCVVVLRALLEPGAYTSYDVAILVAAVAVDARRGGFPVTTPLVFVTWLAAFELWPLSPGEGWFRVLSLLTVAAISLRSNGERVEAAGRLPGLVLSGDPSR